MPITLYILHREHLKCVNEEETEVTSLTASSGLCILAEDGWHNSTEISNITLGRAKCVCYRICLTVEIFFPDGERIKSYSFNLNYIYMKNKSTADIWFLKEI